MKVKICGITRPQDADLVVSLGADYMGVILYEGSKRFVPPERRRELLRFGGVIKVAVFVNPSLSEVEDAVAEGFDLIQLHGEEPLEFAKRVGMERVIKAFRIRDSLPELDEEWRRCHAVLLDTYSEHSYGGTGKTFNWQIATSLVKDGWRVFLSGGLSPENVSRAIGEVKPYCVDVSSGVESAPGVKDPQKLRKFIEEVKKF
jgi:phosphoribosylanthranilate isomerase